VTIRPICIYVITYTYRDWYAVARLEKKTKKRPRVSIMTVTNVNQMYHRDIRCIFYNVHTLLFVSKSDNVLSHCEHRHGHAVPRLKKK